MEYRSEIGKIYDTLFFGLEYFNEKTVKEKFLKRYTNTSFMVECYNEVAKSVSSLPPILKPLFMYHEQMQTVMNAFFIKYIDYKNDTIDSFLQKITNESDFIYSKTLSSLFPDVSDIAEKIKTTPELYIEALYDSDYPEDFKLQISLFFGNFNYIISRLVENLSLIFKAVDSMHSKYANELAVLYKEMNSARNLSLYDRVLGTDIINRGDDYFYSVALLNQYITLLTGSDESDALLLGIHSEEKIYNLINEKNIDMRQLLLAVGNKYRLDILQVFAKQKEISATEIVKTLNMPITSVLRHVEILHNSGILSVSKKCGHQVFYRLNHNLLANSLNIVSNRIGDLLNEKVSND